ncbi:MAG: TIGR03663 family protein, partial [Verrucomicrobiales bacterium]
MFFRTATRVSLPALALVLLGALALGAWLRFDRIGDRPMHTDEAVAAAKLGILIEDGTFQYDPHEYHGPALPYLGRVAAWLRGEASYQELDEATLRAVPAVLGLALIAMLAFAASGLGREGVVGAALLTAVSPMMVYYGRYYIMEMALAAFAFGMILCGWRYYLTRSAGWIVGAGIFAGLMHATKETCVINFAAMGAALLAARIMAEFSAGLRVQRGRQRGRATRHFLYAALAAAAVSALLFSSFFTNPQGPLDSVTTYLHYLDRAGGEGHEKPWWYYLKLLWGKRDGIYWTEAAIVILALIGAGNAFFGKTLHRGEQHHFKRFIAIYAFVLIVFYSAISYKTPWSILCAQHALILLAGVGAGWLIEDMRNRWALAAALLAFGAILYNLAIQSRKATLLYPADQRNPYAYAHTSASLPRLVEKLNALRELNGGELKVQVVHPESGWPLPWYLRTWATAGFRPTTEPGDGIEDADVIIIDAAHAKELSGRLEAAGKAFKSSFG